MTSSRSARPFLALLPPKCGKLCRHLNVTKFVATKMGQTLSPPKTHHNHGVMRKLLSRTASTKTFVATTTMKTCVRSRTKTTKKYAAASNRKKRAAFTNEDLPFCSQTVQPRSRFPTRRTGSVQLMFVGVGDCAEAGGKNRIFC